MSYQICLSGSASGEVVRQSHKQARALGRAIAERGGTLVTGATVGLPHYAVIGFREVEAADGVVIGFSPATSYREHVEIYKLPTKDFDYINYTGMAYVGRDINLVRSSDALILVGGRMGSLHELTTAIDSRKVCGILTGSGGLADYLPELLSKVEFPDTGNIIFNSDPDKLIMEIMAALKSRYADIK